MAARIAARCSGVSAAPRGICTSFPSLAARPSLSFCGSPSLIASPSRVLIALRMAWRWSGVRLERVAAASDKPFREVVSHLVGQPFDDDDADRGSLIGRERARRSPLGLICADAVAMPSAKTAAAAAEPKIDFFICFLLVCGTWFAVLPNPHAIAPSAISPRGIVLIVHVSDGGTTRPKIGVARVECQCTDPFSKDQGCAFVTWPRTGWRKAVAQLKRLVADERNSRRMVECSGQRTIRWRPPAAGSATHTPRCGGSCRCRSASDDRDA